MRFTTEQKQNIERQSRELAELKHAIWQRGVAISDVARKAGYHKNLIHTWFGQLRAGKAHSRIYSETSYRKVWEALDELAPANNVVTQGVGVVDAAAIASKALAKSNGEGKHDAGKDALMKLISSEMEGMSTVRLAMLYAHIVGEEG